MTILRVGLSEKECGAVSQSRQGNLTFQYSRDYPVGSTPISLSMPIGSLVYPKRIVLPFLQGLLPDNDQALKAMGLRYGVNPNNPFALLQNLNEVAGALSFSDTSPLQMAVSGNFQPLGDLDIEQLLLEKINEYEDGTVGLQQRSSLSLAGAQPKLGLTKLADGNWYLPQGDAASTHIIKPVPARWLNLDVVEYQTLAAARNLGLKVADYSLRAFGNTHAFVTARYDRVFSADGHIVRLHQEDLCQALGVPPSKKYQRNDGGPGVGDIARLFRESAFEQQQALSQEFFKGLVFNILAYCTDAHAKNYSVLLDGDSVEFAPLYDLASTASYGLDKLASMSINGKYRFDEIKMTDLLREASRLGLEADWAEVVVQNVSAGLLDSFEKAAEDMQSQLSDAAMQKTSRDVVSALAKLRQTHTLISS